MEEGVCLHCLSGPEYRIQVKSIPLPGRAPNCSEPVRKDEEIITPSSLKAAVARPCYLARENGRTLNEHEAFVTILHGHVQTTEPMLVL